MSLMADILVGSGEMPHDPRKVSVVLANSHLVGGLSVMPVNAYCDIV